MLTDLQRLEHMIENAELLLRFAANLSEEEYKKLTADNWLSSKTNSLQQRLDLINDKISIFS